MAQSIDTTPTADLWANYEQVYDYLNEELFDGKLPAVVLNFATHGRSNGYFTPTRWQKNLKSEPDHQGESGEPQMHRKTAHELSLNPVLLDASIEDCLAWLVRLMVQLWVHERDPAKSSPQGYYPKSFTTKMWELGIPATRDGTPAGAKTGFTMQHWIEEEGKFQNVIDAMPEHFFPWKGEQRQPVKPKNKPIKYGCPNCGTKIMTSKPISAICTTENCQEAFQLVAS